jgi:DNA-binding GntR family transcriptional regulator
MSTAADRAFDALRRDIVEGELPPGAPLTEVEQAARLGVSRTPVREAFARLIAAGLATEHGPRTLVVSEIERDDVDALFELRTALDEQAARLAARSVAAARAAAGPTRTSATPGPTNASAAAGPTSTGVAAETTSASARFAALAERFSAVDRAALAADDPQRHGYYALVAEFDAALDDSLASSRYLAAAIQSTRVHLARVRRLARDDDDRLARSAAEHAAIARAIADGDPERAAAATRLHLHEALTSIHAHLPRSGENRPKERA